MSAALHRIGYLGYSSPALEDRLVGALRHGLLDSGYVEGQNVAIEHRPAEGKLERLPEPAATIPIIVMADPARDGLVASLARPAREYHGVDLSWPELIPKRLGLLKEVVPGPFPCGCPLASGVYGERMMTDMLKEAADGARTLGLHLQLLGATGPNDSDNHLLTWKEPAMVNVTTNRIVLGLNVYKPNAQRAAA